MIDQNTIITMLNDVVPQMQKSKDPEQTLLKYAQDQNLPPAVLERMCHAFNQLKTNCYMDKADSMEKRGSQFSLINAPELIEKYTKFAGENIGKDFNGLINNASSFWDIQPNTKTAIKMASEESKAESLYNLFLDKQDLDKAETLFLKAAKDLEEKPREAKAENFVDTYMDLKQTKENLQEYIQHCYNKRASIIESVKDLIKKDEDLIHKYASYEADAIYLDEDVKAITNLFAKELSFKNGFIAENIKHAGEIKKHLIKEIHPITQALLDYSDVSKCIKVAADISKLTGDSSDEEFRRALEGDPAGEVAEEIAEEAVEEAANSDENKPKESIDQPSEEHPIGKDNANEAAANVGKTNDQSKDVVYLTPSSKDKKYNAVDDIAKGLEGSMNMLQTSLGDGLNSINNINKELLNLAAKPGKEHSGKAHALNTIYNSLSDILFQKLMVTDPILSKVKGSDLDDVIEAYTTYKQQYPEIAFQPALLKSVLRGAAQVGGGEDINTLKELINARKSLAEARSKESLVDSNKYLF